MSLGDDVTGKIKATFGDLPGEKKISSNKNMITVRVSDIYSFEASNRLIKTLVGGGLLGLIISVDRPIYHIKKSLEKKNIPLGPLRFIDAISASFYSPPQDASENVVFLKTPYDLASLTSEIDKYAKATEAARKSHFVLIDSMLSLITYNSIENVESFIEKVTAICESHANVVCISILPEKTKR